MDLRGFEQLTLRGDSGRDEADSWQACVKVKCQLMEVDM